MSGHKAHLALALAIAVGALSVVVATIYLDRRVATVAPAAPTERVSLESVSNPPIPTQQVVVSSRPLPAGARLSAEDLRFEAVPFARLPSQHVLSVDVLLGRRIAHAMQPGEPVVLDNLIPRERDIELAGLLVEGQRAYSLSLSVTGEAAGFVLPGNRVDILLSRAPQGATERAFSRVILQNIKVLAVAQDRYVEDRSVPRPTGLITVEVTPSQAEVLDVARSVGALSFALRPHSDHSTSITLGTRQEELHGSKPIIEVIRGAVLTRE